MKIFPYIFLCYGVSNIIGTSLFFLASSPMQMFITVAVIALVGLVVNLFFFEVEIQWNEQPELSVTDESKNVELEEKL